MIIIREVKEKKNTTLPWDIQLNISKRLFASICSIWHWPLPETEYQTRWTNVYGNSYHLVWLISSFRLDMSFLIAYQHITRIGADISLIVLWVYLQLSILGHFSSLLSSILMQDFFISKFLHLLIHFLNLVLRDYQQKAWLNCNINQKSFLVPESLLLKDYNLQGCRLQDSKWSSYSCSLVCEFLEPRPAWQDPKSFPQILLEWLHSPDLSSANCREFIFLPLSISERNREKQKFYFFFTRAINCTAFFFFIWGS